jgi:hypothetical protein
VVPRSTTVSLTLLVEGKQLRPVEARFSQGLPNHSLRLQTILRLPGYRHRARPKISPTTAIVSRQSWYGAVDSEIVNL